MNGPSNGTLKRTRDEGTRTRTNGVRPKRASTASSSGGHKTPYSSTDDEQHAITTAKRNGKPKPQPKPAASEYEETIRVGRDYQATCPPMQSPRKRAKLVETATLLWSPSTHHTDQQLDEYIAYMTQQHGLDIDQAFGMLMYCNKDIGQAKREMANFVRMATDWSEHEKVVFEQAVSLHNKNFDHIKNLVGDRSMRDIILYYYMWKKSKKAAKYQNGHVAGGGIGCDRVTRSQSCSTTAAGATAGSSSLPNGYVRPINGTVTPYRDSPSQLNGLCANCGSIISALKQTALGYYCLRCCAPEDRLPPESIYLPTEAIATYGQQPLPDTARQCAELMSQLQRLKQNVEAVEVQLLDERKAAAALEQRVPTSSTLSVRWTTGEMQLMDNVIKRHGRDVQRIVELVGTKTEYDVQERLRRNLRQSLAVRQTQPPKTAPAPFTATSRLALPPSSTIMNGGTDVPIVEISDSEDEEHGSSTAAASTPSRYGCRS